MPALAHNITDRFQTMAAKDPTQTVMLRNAFVKEMEKRFRELKKAIKISVIDNDCFGVAETVAPVTFAVTPVTKEKFKYARDQAKVQGFLDWLDVAENEGILEVAAMPENIGVGQVHWSNTYVRGAYQKGAIKARQKLISEGAKLPSYLPTDGALSAVFNQPIHADRIAMIYTRVYSELDGITKAMEGHISNILSKTIASGLGPNQAVSQLKLVEDINAKVDAIGLNRARMIARTEIVESHNEGTINECEASESIIKEKVYVQWITAGDERVRPEHISRQGEVYERDEARDLLGEPYCRCSVVPYTISANGSLKDAKKKAKIEQAIIRKKVEEEKKRLKEEKKK